MTTARRITTLVGLFLTLVLPLAFALPWWRQYVGVSGQILTPSHEALWWALVAIVLAWVTVVERRGLGSIGLRRPGWRSIAFGFLGFGLIAGAGVLAANVMAHFGLAFNASAYQKVLGLPYWLRFLIVLRAGVAEELFFRGYGIERLQELTGSKWVAAAITLAIFSLAHISYWGVAQVVIAGSAGLVLTLLYLWRRDLVTNMIAHFLTDAMGLLLR